MKELIKKIKRQVKEIKDSDMAMEENSWNNQDGVLITGTEAELIIAALESSQEPGRSVEGTAARKIQNIADILYSHIKQMMGLCYISQNDIPDIAKEIASKSQFKEQPITDEQIFDTLSILSVDKDGHITGKNEVAKWMRDKK